MRTKDEQKVAFGQKVKMYRKRLGLVQRDIPGFSHTIIANYEAGKSLPRGKRLWELARALNVRPEDLLPPTAQSLSSTRHRSYSRAMEAMACDDWESALLEAQDFSRVAFRLGDAALIDQSYVLMDTIAPHIPEDEVVRSVLRYTRDLPILRRMVSKAFRSGHYQLALLINETEWRVLQDGTTYSNEDYGRIVRNRARLLLELGQFDDSIHWYRKAQALARELQNGVVLNACILSESECRLHAGLPTLDVDSLAHWALESRMTWRIYWHHQAYRAWRSGEWTQLARLLKEAYESYRWTDGRDDLLLEVMHTALLIHQGDDAALARLDPVLTLPNLDHVAGDGARRDILYDYVQLLLDLEHPSATLEWSMQLHAAHSSERYGWEHCFLQRHPRPLNYDAIPVAIRGVVQQLVDHPPAVPRDILVMEEITPSLPGGLVVK